MEYLQNIAVPALLCIAVGYLLGSVSFSIILTRIFSKTDIRSVGSGNAGATNVLRSVGKGPALMTFAFDFLKCVVAVIIARMIFQHFYNLTAIPPFVIGQYGAYIGGLACVVGHIYPLYFKFRGGKGVVTAIAMIMIIDWRVSLFVWGVFFIAVGVSKMVSLGSICGATVYPVATFGLTYFIDFQASSLVPFSYVIIATSASLLLGSLVVFKHRGNIQRIRNGTEKRLGGPK